MLGKWFYPGMLLLAGVLIVIDQLCKNAVLSGLLPGEEKDLLGSLQLTLVYNPNFAFGISLVPDSLRIPFVITTLIILVLLLWRLLPSPWVFFSGSLLLAGGLSNLYDRFTRGEIVDYLLLPHWPAFNLADTWVTLGFILFIVYLLFFSSDTIFKANSWKSQ